VTAYVAALAVTELVEAPVYVGVLAGIMRVPVPRTLCASFVVNLISHPLFNALLLPGLDHVFPALAALLTAELMVCALEALLLLAWLRRAPTVLLAASLIANACSFAVGQLVL
jgi:hypothetical protein